MPSTTYLEEQNEEFNGATGEITQQSKVKKIKHKTEKTDEFIKVSKYLNVIFAYNDIPLSMVPISLLFAQRMEFKTNILLLQKDDKEQIAEMLGCGIDRVNRLILDAKKYDIIRPINNHGKYEVNAFLFSTGDFMETRKLQAHFDFDNEKYYAIAEQKNLITGTKVRKAIKNYNDKIDKNQIPGQMSLEDYGGVIDE